MRRCHKCENVLFSRGRNDHAACNCLPTSVDRESYLSLADEFNDEPMAWVEDDWDAEDVAGARRFAKEYGYPFPPTVGTFDRLYDEAWN